jgi:hypothetical protein
VPKYFLSIRLGGVGIDDTVGEAYANDEAALAEAEASAHEMIRDASSLGVGPRKGCITVSDEAGKILGTVSFSSSVTLLRSVP